MHNTREAWLEAGVALLWPLLPERDRSTALPPIKVSVGWPKGRHGKKAIGECWDIRASADGSTSHIFISPEIKLPEHALAVLCHELCHVWAGTEAKHRGPFIKAAKAFGLDRPWTATNPTVGLASHLAVVVAELGPYPHVGLVAVLKPKQKTRMRLYECSCGKKIRCADDALRGTHDDCGTVWVLIRKPGEGEEDDL